MRILYIAYTTIPGKAANTVNVVNMCESIAKLGHNVILILPNWKRDKSINVYKYYGLSENFDIQYLFSGNFSGIKKIIFFVCTTLKILALRPDAVFGRHFSTLYLATVLGFPSILDLHLYNARASRFYHWLFKRFSKNKNLITLITNTQALKDLVIKKYDIPEARVAVAHNGCSSVDLSEKAVLSSKRKALQVGYFGHLYKGRGIGLILELAAHFQKMDFRIFGGEEKDVLYWKQIKNDENLENVFFYGHIPPADTYKYRNACDILLAPYGTKVMVAGGKDETSSYMCPIKILEYKASKKAIVVSNIAVIHEILNEDQAIFAAPGQLEDWIRALEELKNDSRRAKLAENAYQDFLENNTWLHRARKVIRLFQPSV